MRHRDHNGVFTQFTLLTREWEYSFRFTGIEEHLNDYVSAASSFAQGKSIVWDRYKLKKVGQAYERSVFDIFNTVEHEYLSWHESHKSRTSCSSYRTVLLLLPLCVEFVSQILTSIIRQKDGVLISWFLQQTFIKDIFYLWFPIPQRLILQSTLALQHQDSDFLNELPHDIWAG